MLHASQFPTVWPEPLIRVTVALGLLQAVAVAIVLVRARRIVRDDEVELERDEQPRQAAAVT
jgi:hypothetical protein